MGTDWAGEGVRAGALYPNRPVDLWSALKSSRPRAGEGVRERGPSSPTERFRGEALCRSRFMRAGDEAGDSERCMFSRLAAIMRTMILAFVLLGLVSAEIRWRDGSWKLEVGSQGRERGLQKIDAVVIVLVLRE